MSDGKEITKYISDQKPLNQVSEPINNNQGNNINSENPIKPEETQKDIVS